MGRSESPASRPLPERNRASHAAYWRRLAAASSVEEFCAAWLALQCGQLCGIGAAAVLVGAPEEGRPYAPVAVWPDKQGGLQRFAEAAQRAINERRGVVISRESAGDGSSRSCYDIAYPVHVAGRVQAVVVLEADSRPAATLHDDVRRLQWGAAWLEVFFNRSRLAATAAAQDRLQTIVGIVAAIVPNKSFQGAAVALATELAARFRCDRVSIGLVRRGGIRVQAISHSALFGKNTDLIRAIGAAMDECFDQQACVVFPSPEGAVVTRRHEELAKRSENRTVCSVPLSGQTETIGVVTFERADDQPFDAATLQLFAAVSSLAGPILEVLRRDDRRLPRKALDSAAAQVRALIGPRHVATKLTVFGIAAAILFFVFATGPYRVTARSVIEPASRRAVVAAYDGYIRSAPLRAGELVRQGQVLAEMDDRELKLERSKLQSQLEQTSRQYYEALGARKAADVQVFTAQIAQARAQVALLDEQIARTRIVAPIDGVIITGDLSQSLGAPIERGQVLFELAPLDSYRVVLQVDERDIADVAAGQRGRVVLSGFAGEPLNFSIERLTPVSVAEEGRNFFRVEARLESGAEHLRPGMEGVGKIDVDRRRLIWIWTHEVIDWLRLKIWNWIP